MSDEILTKAERTLINKRAFQLCMGMFEGCRQKLREEAIRLKHAGDAAPLDVDAIEAIASDIADLMGRDSR